MKTETFELLYNWVTASGMNAPDECLDMLDDPIRINRELEGAPTFNGCSPSDCLDILQTRVRDRLAEESEQQACSAQINSEALIQ